MDIRLFDLTDNGIFRNRHNEYYFHLLNTSIFFNQTVELTHISFHEDEFYGLGKLNEKFQTKSQIKKHEKKNFFIGSLRDMFFYNKYNEHYGQFCNCCGKPTIMNHTLCNSCSEWLKFSSSSVIRRIRASI